MFHPIVTICFLKFDLCEPCSGEFNARRKSASDQYLHLEDQHPTNEALNSSSDIGRERYLLIYQIN